MVFMLVAGAITFAPAVMKLEFGSGSLEEIGIVTREILEIHAVVWPVVIACLIAVSISSLFLFKRMTEPLSRFVKVFERIGRGELPAPIELRAGDYLKREMKALNEMTAELRSLIGEVKRNEAELSSAIEEVAEASRSIDSEQLSAPVDALLEHAKSLRDSVARFGDHA